MKVTGFLGALVLAASIASSGSAQQGETPAPATAQTAEAQTQDYRDKAARGLFEAGSVAFEEGRYEEALNHFSKAYELSPNRHLLLYNIGSSLDRLRRDKEALTNFEKYLELNPTAPNRPAVEARVKLLREAVAKQDEEAAEQQRLHQEEEARRAQEAQAQVQPEVAPAEAPAERRGLSPIYTYVGAGLTAALGGVTVWSGLDTLSRNDTYEKEFKGLPPSQKNYDRGKEHYDAGVKAQNRTNLLIGVTGTVAVATAVVAIFFTDWKGEEPAEEQPTIPVVQAFASPEGAGMELRHAF